METVDTQFSEAIPYFVGQYSFLSNFHVGVVPFHGFEYPSAENAYQSEKTHDQGLRAAFRDQNMTPAMAKRLGRTLKLRPDWDEVKDKIMLDIVRAKFTTPKLRLQLGQTGNKFLFEGNHWHDTYWGICDGQHGNYRDVKAHPGIVMGYNKLGKILEKVRFEIWQGKYVDL